MIHRAKSPEIDLSWQMRDGESRLLAESMRSSRLTLLSAEAGMDRTGLLTRGVLPLLRRRASDAVGDEDRESRVVIPFSDRRLRRAGRSSTRVAERLVLFDGWGAAPMAALRNAVLASLPEDAVTYARSSRLAPMLGELSRRFDAHFLIVLDSFERFWHPALELDAAEQFVDELSEAVNSEELRAHFLLSIDNVAEPCLDVLRQRVPGFDDSSLHLLRGQSIATSLPLDASSGEGAAARFDAVSTPASTPTPILPAATALPRSTPVKKPRRPRPPRVPFVTPAPIKTEGVYAFIESTLSQTASDFAPWQDDELRSQSAGSVAPVSAAPQARQGRLLDTRPDRATASIEPPKPVDKWLTSAFAWLRRR